MFPVFSWLRALQTVQPFTPEEARRLNELEERERSYADILDRFFSVASAEPEAEESHLLY